jgi:type VI secretion system secreted protein VgrG
VLCTGPATLSVASGEARKPARANKQEQPSMGDMAGRSGNQADFTFQAADLTTEDLKVTGFTGTEGLSELYHFRLELISELRDIDFATLVGKNGLLEIASPSGSRYVSGIIRGFARTQEGAKLTHYEAELVPLHWLLTKRLKARIFQTHNCPDMTVPGIVKQVMKDAGIPDDACRWALEKTDYVEREYVVQYRETDFAFLSRLLEDEGIFYFFEHSAEGHKMVFGDSPVAHVPAQAQSEFAYRDPTASTTPVEFVFRAHDRQEIQHGAVCLDDFNFTKPPLELRASVQAADFTSLEFSDYPGEYQEKEAGTHYAGVRLEEFQAARRVARFSTTIRGLLPGYKFSLAEHPAEALNREYLVTHVTHRATQRQSGEAEQVAGAQGTAHQTEVRAIPSDVPYRPPRKTAKPVVLGSQTALVTGPAGEEIYTDDEGYGRVKVQFHWDREGKQDENSSCWVRCSQGWAGGTYGMIFLPRVGQEVIVDFLEGNPDRPIITGRVHNNDNMPPHKLPDNKTQSGIKTRSSKGGEGFNELRFEDKKDDEQIFLHAQKDFHLRVKQDQKDWIERDKHESIQRDQLKKIGRDEHRTIQRDQMTEVTRDRSLKVGGKDASDVGSYTLNSGGDLALIAKGSASLESSITIGFKSSAGVDIDGGVEISLKAGPSFINIGPAGVSISGPMVMINSGGSAVAPTMASAAAATAPKAPDPPITGDPGKDYVYQAETKPYDPEKSAPWHDESQEETDERHWIGIRLFDDNGKRLANEKYEIVLPDGTTIASGTLDQNGEKELRGLKLPGDCQVRFPDLDSKTWEAGPPPPSEDGGGAGGGNGSPTGGAAGALPSAPGVPGGLPGL